LQKLTKNSEKKVKIARCKLYLWDMVPSRWGDNVNKQRERVKSQSSQIYLYSAFHNCIKAASQYQSRQLNSVCLFMGKKDNQDW